MYEPILQEQLSTSFMDPADFVTGSRVRALGEYRQYRFRWIIVLLFDLVSFVNAVLWISFTPVNSYAQAYYQKSATMIDLFSSMFMILFLPGLVLCAFFTYKYSLRITCVSASALNFLAALLRYFSTLNDKTARPGGYAVALCGQILASLAQPVSISLPGRIATAWFSDHQRNIAIVLLSLSNVIGIAVGQTLASVLVDADSGFPQLQLVVLVLASVSFVACVVLFREAPPTPPSLHADDRSKHETSDNIIEHLSSNIRLMFQSRSFLAISVGFGLGLGVFNVLLTKIEAIVLPFNSDDAGVFGAICMLSGFVGSGVFGATMDATRAHQLILRICTFSSLILLEILFIALKLGGSYVIVCLAFAGFGFFLLPLMPICIECAALCTYPVPEEMSTGALMLFGNLAGFIGTLITSEYAAESFIPAVSLGNLILSLAFIIAAVGMLFFRYRAPVRQQDSFLAKSSHALFHRAV